MQLPPKSLSILLTLCLLTTFLSACKKSTDTPLAVPSQINWQSCQDRVFQNWFQDAPPSALQCGYVKVPLAYADGNLHDKALVTLAVTRLPASKAKKGVLVAVSGGPGLQGINWPANMGEVGLLKVLNESYDLIGYDPRGVGQSRPAVTCPQYTNAEPDDGDAEQLIRQTVAACVKKTGIEVLKHIGTHEAVNDLDMIRQALGEAQLNIVAYSYGTKVAALYAERFPAQTRAMVLDGVVDLSEDDLSMRINQEKAAQQSFERFVRYCQAATACPLPADSAKAVQSYQALLRKLDAAPLHSKSGELVSGADVLASTRLLLLWSDRWPDLVHMLVQLNQGQVDEKTFSLLKESKAFEASSAALTAITCADVASPAIDSQTRQQNKRRIASAAAFANYTHQVDYSLEDCDIWPFAGKDQPHVPRVAPSLPPLLFVAQRFDPSTPYHNAQRMAQYFNSPLVTREGDGHTLALFGVDQCVDKEVVDYLLWPDKTRGNKTCG